MDSMDIMIGVCILPLALAFAAGIGVTIGEALKEPILKAKKRSLDFAQQALEALIKDTKQGHPDLAQQIADIEYEYDFAAAAYLEHKKHPAKKAADEVKAIAAEKRALKAENKVLTYQINFYEQLFPWLADFKEESIPDALAAVSDIPAYDYDTVRNWISPAEYQRMDSANRNQLALDRWKNKKKSAWEIGICYERYVGYLLEEKGYRVKYFGATMGLEDMGRDLIADKDGTTLVIQCKRWAKEKTIHEKHICQLYGSVAVLASQNPGKTYKGVFISSTSLSDVAKMFAEYSNISVVENLELADYPLVKCNISKGGEKIYHLPFDQQYDKINIQKDERCRYVSTTKEAEKLGFRRAYSWRSSSAT